MQPDSKAIVTTTSKSNTETKNAKSTVAVGNVVEEGDIVFYLKGGKKYINYIYPPHLDESIILKKFFGDKKGYKLKDCNYSLCKLKELPETLKDYTGCYLWIESDYRPLKLYYVKVNAQLEEVNIKDFKVFKDLKWQSKTELLKNEYKTSVVPKRLTPKELKNMITSNGGHVPDDRVSIWSKKVSDSLLNLSHDDTEVAALNDWLEVIDIPISATLQNSVSSIFSQRERHNILVGEYLSYREEFRTEWVQACDSKGQPIGEKVKIPRREYFAMAEKQMTFWLFDKEVNNCLEPNRQGFSSNQSLFMYVCMYFIHKYEKENFIKEGWRWWGSHGWIRLVEHLWGSIIEKREFDEARSVLKSEFILRSKNFSTQLDEKIETYQLSVLKCDFHFMKELPRVVDKFLGSYIFLKKDPIEKSEVYYIQFNGNAVLVKLKNIQLILEVQKECIENVVTLSYDRTQKLIVQNGGDSRSLWELDCMRKLRLAYQGDAASQFEIGQLYYTGKYVIDHVIDEYEKHFLHHYEKEFKRDKATATQWYSLAAKQNYAAAQLKLGACYEIGEGVKQDYKEALGWYNKAADQKYPDAEKSVERIKRQIIKEQQQTIFADKLKLAEQGNFECQLYIINGYITGENIPKNIKEASKWYITAAAQKDEKADSRLDVLKKELEKEKQQLEFDDNMRRAQQGDVHCQYYVGNCYHKGDKVKQNVSKAIEWYRKAAEEYHAESQNELGLCYENGDGIKVDEQQALQWYENAALQKHSKGQENLQRLKKKIEDREKARKFESHLELAKRDNLEAQTSVGICYLNGTGVEVDHAQAVFWLNKAAKKDDMEAQYQLGLCSENGWFVEKDLGQASIWYKKAIAQGYAGARDKLLNLQKQLADEKAGAVSPMAVQSPVAIKNPNQSIFINTPTADSKVATSPKDISVSYIINHAELQMGKELGRGGYGVVYQGTWRVYSVAVKQLLVANPKPDLLEEFKAETQIMAKLRSPNIVQFYGCVLGNPTYCIVMEYMPKGSLYNVLHNDKEVLGWETRYKITTDIACGLAFLHSESILHRDLKSLNVLLDEHYRAKLTDFGLSKIKNESRSKSSAGGAVGTYAWMAPELISDDAHYTPKADIYSFAVVLWEIAARKIPFEKENPMLIPIKASQGKREAIPADCPPKIASLIKFCWHADQNKRPTAKRVVEYLRAEDEKEFTEIVITPTNPVAVSTAAAAQDSYPANLNSNVNLNASAAADYTGNLNSGVSYSR